MSFIQKSLSALLSFGLVALLSNSAFAIEQNATTKNESGHSWSKEQKDCHGDRFAKHMAALHTALKLSANQEAAWKDFSNKMKPVAMDQPAHKDWRDMSTPDRLDRMLDMMKDHEKKMAEHAANVRTFYDTLTADQKKIFDEHFMGRHHFGHFRGHPHDDNHQSHGGM